VDQYQHLDEQGTVVIQSDPTGAALIGVVDPNPWGGFNSVNPFGWLGQPGYWYENGLRRPLYYVRARWYQTGGPGWLSPDPLRFGGGDRNLYRYVRSRPTVAVDPSGLVSALAGTSRWIFGSCGGFKGFYGLFLDHQALQDGYIVQKNTISKTGMLCNKTIVGKTSNVFWEAWPVTKGSTRPDLINPSDYNDEVCNLSAPSELRGHVVVAGEIRFYYRTTTKDLGGYNTWPAGPNAAPGWGQIGGGSLPTYKGQTPPDFWNKPSDQSEMTGSRTVDITFCCCGGTSWTRTTPIPQLIDYAPSVIFQGGPKVGSCP
jgi:RHS repeat-associated protein